VKYRWNRFERIFSRRYHYSVPGVLSDALSPGIPLNLEERATKPGELSPVAKILATKRVTFTLADKNVLENRLCFSCLVDVDRVPPRLMSALGIIKWDRARRMRGEDVLQEIKKPEHLVRLKLIFDAAKRIDAGERFIVVQKPSDALLDVYCRRLRAAGETKLANSLSIPDEAIGKILVISEEVSGSLMQSKPQLAKLVPVPLKVAVVDSIYAARRGTHHAAVGYAAERETLAKAAANIEHISTRVKNEWKKETQPKVKQAIKHDLKSIVEELAPDFQNSTNIFKSKTYDVLCAIQLSLEEDIGVNPQAKAQQLLKISRQLTARETEAAIKDSYRVGDGGAIDLLIKKWEGAFEVLERTMQAKANFFNSSEKLFRRKGDLSQIQEGLALSVEPFREMTARPFCSFASAIFETEQDLKEAINDLDRPKVLQLLVKVDIICRLQRVQRGLEQLIVETSRGRIPSFDQLRDIAGKLEKSLPQRTSLGAKAYGEVYPNYHQLRKKISIIHSRLCEYCDKPMTPQQSQEVFKNLRQHVKNDFDIEGELKGLADFSE
jgi:hypothetical protein